MLTIVCFGDLWINKVIVSLLWASVEKYPENVENVEKNSRQSMWKLKLPDQISLLQAKLKSKAHR